ncbi:MAG: metal ABC transporter permease [Stackebrandtia sp.]
MDIFGYDFMLRAMAGALIVGAVAPAVGVFLVQKRMALIGDGLGHVALTGVAFGFLTGASPLWTTLAATSAGAVAVELIRSRGKASGDVALALLFYGGIAGGVFVTGLVDGATVASLNEFLFGSLLTTTAADLWIIGGLGAVVAALMLALRRWLAAVCHDEEHARVSGLPVQALNLLLAVTTAATVSVAMRAVGLLLVSALLVVPVVTVQQVTRGFAVTMYAAMAAGFAAAGTGFVTAGLLNVPPGAAIVLLAVGLFVVVALGRAMWTGTRRRLMVAEHVVPTPAPRSPVDAA